MKTKSGPWIKSSEQLPPYNVGVFVFIPEEDHHITAGMYDISDKWILLDEYRQPKSEVTYWCTMIEEPADKSYTPSFVHTDDLEKTADVIRKQNKRHLDDCMKISQLVAKIGELEKLISSDSVYTLLRLGWKSPSRTGVDELDDHYIDLYHTCEVLRNKKQND